MNSTSPRHSMYKGTRLSLSEVTPDVSKIPDLLRSYTIKRKIRNCSSNGMHLKVKHFAVSKYFHHFLKKKGQQNYCRIIRNFYCRWQWSVLLPQLPRHQVCVRPSEVTRCHEGPAHPNLPQLQWWHREQENKPWKLLWNNCWAPQPALWG